MNIINNSILFFPKKMLLAEVTGGSCDYLKVEKAIEEKYSDVLGDSPHYYEWVKDKYKDDAIDYNEIITSRAGICLTDACQLRCNYCTYSSDSCDKETINKDNIKAFINLMIKNIIKKKLVTKYTDMLQIYIAGGGEPTFKWRDLCECVEYIKKTCQKYNINYSLGITTNGCINEQQIKYLTDNFSSILVSFDGSPMLQNKNRRTEDNKGTFEILNKIIKYLDNIKFNYAIRSTVWAEDYKYLMDMADFICTNYPNATSWEVEPIVATGRAVNKINTADLISEKLFNNELVHYYIQTKAHIKKMNYPDIMVCSKFKNNTIQMLCGTLFGMHPWLLPSGKIVTCMDAKDQAIQIGKIDNGIVKLGSFIDKFSQKHFEYRNECKNCSAFYFCGAGCPLKKSTSEKSLTVESECNMIKEYWHYMFENLIEKKNYFNWQLFDMEYDELSDVKLYELRRV